MSSSVNYKYIIFLNILLAVYSTAGIFSKIAAKSEFLSLRFILCYTGMIVILGIYAICWQQLIGKLPLTVAYANKAVTVAWGMIFGYIIFKEGFTIRQFIGAVIVVAGVILFVISDGKENER